MPASEASHWTFKRLEPASECLMASASLLPATSRTKLLRPGSSACVGNRDFED